MPTPINIGFVGLSAGGWGRVLEPAIRSLGDIYRIVAVSTTNEASAKASAQRVSELTAHPVKGYHGDMSQIANDPDVDFVVVTVKAPYHKDAVLPVIQAKKPFFVEWPAGRDLQETRELADAARQNGVRSIVGLQARQSPVLNKAKELIASGKIGKVLSCSVIAGTNQELLFFGPFVKRSTVYTTNNSTGGSMLDIAVGHHLDPLLHVLGSGLSSISATTSIQYPTVTLVHDDGTPTNETVSSNAPDHIAFHGTLDNGALLSVSFRGGYKSTPGRHQLLWVIDGEAGSIRVQNTEQGGTFVNIRPPKLYLNDEEIVVDTSDYLSRNLAAQFAEFAKGEEGKYATLDDAVKVRELLDAIAKSGQNKVDLSKSSVPTESC